LSGILLFPEKEAKSVVLLRRSRIVQTAVRRAQGSVRLSRLAIANLLAVLGMSELFVDLFAEKEAIGSV
jgi:hypothetical protein